MNTHDKTNELLIAFALGELSPQESSDVETHLAECPQCTTKLEELRTVLESAEALSRISADEQTCELAKQRILEATASKQTTKPPAAIEPIWRMIMTTKKFRLAAAAIIVIAAVIGVNSFLGGTVTFAQVVKPILNARTVVFDFLVGNEKTSPVMHEVVAGSRIRRTVSNMPNMVMILDLDETKMLVLDTNGKTAAYVDLKGDVGDKTRGYIKAVREIITNLQNGADIQKLEECQIDGQKAIGFKAGNPKEGITIWANRHTKLPIRVELQLGKLFVVLKNFEFDVDIEPSLISMDVPQGYTLDKAQFDLSDANEQDLIESLRIWAEILLDGTFPDAIGTEAFMKQVAVLGQKIPQLDLPDSEKEQLGIKFARGMLFLQPLEMGGEWRYAGKGVKLGDAAAPIFWYQPKGSETYRVIYGDLSVKDVAQQDLPK
jgi:outer membrane lipoprotein-sorting protein